MATQTVLAASGDIMVANALRQAEPDVMAAYPITPQTIIVEEFDKFVADGRVHTEYVNVESEHSAMSATIGASAAGSRAVTDVSLLCGADCSRTRAPPALLAPIAPFPTLEDSP